MDNKKRRDSGMAYLVDKEVLAELLRCRRLLQQLNQADWADHGSDTPYGKASGKKRQRSHHHAAFFL